MHGPEGLRALFSTLRRIFGTLTYPVDLVEHEPWEDVQRDGYRITAFPVAHGSAAFGYALVEDERPGRFDVEAADALGVPDGPARGALQRGETVTLVDGTAVEPGRVLGTARPGRSLVLSGDTAPTASVVEIAAGADLLVHEATFCAEEADRARETMHSTAGAAALAAREAGVRLLALTHLSSRYPPSAIAEEAQQVFPETVVPRDFDVIELPFPERGPPVLVPRGARTGAPGVGSEV